MPDRKLAVVTGASTGIGKELARCAALDGCDLVIAAVVFALLRWMSHLMTFGRMGDTLDRVEAAAKASLTTGLSPRFSAGARSAPRSRR